jgi:N6-adenosine-specific RNA methylase IME4
MKDFTECTCTKKQATLILLPIYDDGGALLCVEQEWKLIEECKTCLHNFGHDLIEAEMWNHYRSLGYED